MRLKRDTGGAIILLLALLLPLLVGLVGLAIDVSNWYYAERRVQTAADAAAVAGALSLYQTQSDVDAQAAAVDSASRNHFQAGSGTTLVYNSPPSSGPFASDLSAVEIIATEDQPLYFADILFAGSATARTRAVAAPVVIPRAHCILGLGEDIDGAVTFTGSADIDMGCGIASNSQTDESLIIWGNAAVDAEPMTSAGDIVIGGSGSLEPSDQTLYTYELPVLDPYGPEGRDLQVPSNPAGCTYTDLQITNTTITLAPGRYCNGIKITGSDVTFLAGEHIIDGGVFDVSGNSTITAIEVVFILTGSGSDYATVKFNGGATTDISAPISGTFDGVAFFGDPAAPTYQGSQLISNDFLGGSDMKIIGAIYDPAREVVFTGGLGLLGNCLQIVAYKVTMTGSGAVANDCPADIDVDDILARRVKLVE